MNENNFSEFLAYLSPSVISANVVHETVVYEDEDEISTIWGIKAISLEEFCLFSDNMLGNYKPTKIHKDAYNELATFGITKEVFPDDKINGTKFKSGIVVTRQRFRYQHY